MFWVILNPGLSGDASIKGMDISHTRSEWLNMTENVILIPTCQEKHPRLP